MRFWVRSHRARMSHHRSDEQSARSNFQGPCIAIEGRSACDPFRHRLRLLRLNRLRRSGTLTSDENRRRRNAQRLRTSSVAVGQHIARTNRDPRTAISSLATCTARCGAGIFAGFPFAARGSAPHSYDLRRRLRSDLPCLVRRSTGNLLHYGPPGSTEVQATATTISTRDRSTPTRDGASMQIASPPYPSILSCTAHRCESTRIDGERSVGR